MKSIEIPKEAAAIISTLETNGFKAYAVGGCVRDRLLGAVPHDWDITTSARPDEINKRAAHGKPPIRGFVTERFRLSGVTAFTR